MTIHLYFKSNFYHLLGNRQAGTSMCDINLQDSEIRIVGQRNEIMYADPDKSELCPKCFKQSK